MMRDVRREHAVGMWGGVWEVGWTGPRWCGAPAVEVREHVRRLEVAVDDRARARVQVRTRREHVGEHAHDVGLGLGVTHRLVQGALEELHHDPRRGRGGGRADALHDARVAQAREHRDLLLQLRQDLCPVLRRHAGPEGVSR